jgi:hypothetical protein
MILSKLMNNLERIRDISKSGKITNKQDFFLLYEAGLLGNKAITWKSYEEILNSGWKGLVCIRGKDGIQRGRVKYNVYINDAPKVIEGFREDGIENITFNQSMPDEHLIIQGEVMRTFLGLSLWYTTKKVPMNKALAEESLYANGLKANLILEAFMDSSSYSDLKALFDLFPDSVIEFSTYDIAVGDIPNRNTVIWEVRNY